MTTPQSPMPAEEQYPQQVPSPHGYPQQMPPPPDYSQQLPPPPPSYTHHPPPPRPGAAPPDGDGPKDKKRPPKRLLVLGLAALLVVAGATTGIVVATGNDSKPGTTATATLPDQPAPAEEPADELATVQRGTAVERAIYLQVVRDEMPRLASVSDQSLLNVAYAIVDAYEAGVPFSALVAIAMDSGFTAYESGYLIGAAVYVFAPELGPQLQADSEAYDASR